MPASEPQVLLDGLHFPESPRWHEGRLYFVDFYAYEVVAVDLRGNRETVASVPGMPGGLGVGAQRRSAGRIDVGLEAPAI